MSNNVELKRQIRVLKDNISDVEEDLQKRTQILKDNPLDDFYIVSVRNTGAYLKELQERLVQYEKQLKG